MTGTGISGVHGAIAELSAEAVDKESAEVVIKDLIRLFDHIECELAEIGVKYQVDVSLGDYGSGRSLILNEEDASQWDGDYDVGDWLPSSATC